MCSIPGPLPWGHVWFVFAIHLSGQIGIVTFGGSTSLWFFFHACMLVDHVVEGWFIGLKLLISHWWKHMHMNLIKQKLLWLKVSWLNLNFVHPLLTHAYIELNAVVTGVWNLTLTLFCQWWPMHRRLLEGCTHVWLASSFIDLMFNLLYALAYDGG